MFNYEDYQFLDNIPVRSKANLYEVIMNSLQGAAKWSREGFKCFLIKY